jgi:hypothetical protein
MISKPKFSNTAGKYRLCPLPKTHRRLAEAHLLWHQTLDKYHDPEAFRANLNATIEALRNITFVIQNEKSAFAKFDEWYGSWQSRLKANEAAKWLHNARTTVVHQGELESYSTAEVRLITWRDEVLAKVIIPVEAPPSIVLQSPLLIDRLKEYQASAAYSQDAAIAIERCWSTKDLGKLEILEVLAEAYGLLSDMVLDAHACLGKFECIPADHDHPDFRSVHHRTGTLECMSAGVEKRTQVFKFSTGERLDPVKTVWPTTPEEQTIIDRYGIDRTFSIVAWEKLDPVRFAEKVLYHAKQTLRQDKKHDRLMFIRDGRGEWHLRALIAADRTEKHLIVRTVAQFVENNGCDAIVEVSEVWNAPAESVPGLDSSRIQEAKGHGESLYVMVATREGITRRYLTPIKRGPFGGIKLGDTDQADGEFAHYLQPIFEVWHKQGIINLSGGNAMRRIWEPDALDICFCGGPKRFGECCRPNIPLAPDSSEFQDEINRPLTAAELARAEELSRAALAQYVIWVKRHTVIAMYLAPDLYRKLVDIDVLALEEAATQLQARLEANGNDELFLPQMRYLASIIGAPRLSMRLVALASHWLLKSGRTEEAILELDGLGDMDKIDDSLVLLTVANLFDLSTKRKEKLLLRAFTLALSQEEEWLSTSAIVEHMLTEGRPDKALSAIDAFVAKSRGSNGQSGLPPEAFLLRWKLTKSESDLQVFMEAIENSEGSSRIHYAESLIDLELYTEAERFLAPDIESGDLIAKLVITNSHIFSGDGVSARGLFLQVEQTNIPHESQHAYAVTSARLALLCKDEKIRQSAILALREWSASGTMDEVAKKLLLALESEKFGEQPATE